MPPQPVQPVQPDPVHFRSTPAPSSAHPNAMQCPVAPALPENHPPQCLFEWPWINTTLKRCTSTNTNNHLDLGYYNNSPTPFPIIIPPSRFRRMISHPWINTTREYEYIKNPGYNNNNNNSHNSNHNNNDTTRTYSSPTPACCVPVPVSRYSKSNPHTSMRRCRNPS